MVLAGEQKSLPEPGIEFIFMNLCVPVLVEIILKVTRRSINRLKRLWNSTTWMGYKSLADDKTEFVTHILSKVEQLTVIVCDLVCDQFGNILGLYE